MFLNNFCYLLKFIVLPLPIKQQELYEVCQQNLENYLSKPVEKRIDKVEKMLKNLYK